MAEEKDKPHVKKLIDLLQKQAKYGKSPAARRILRGVGGLGKLKKVVPKCEAKE